MSGLVDDTHAATADDGLHLVARDTRHVGNCGGRVVCLRREQRIQLRSYEAHLLPAFAHFGQQLGEREANLFRRAFRIEDLIEQLLHPLFVGHCSALLRS